MSARHAPPPKDAARTPPAGLRAHGLLPWVLPAMLAVTALDVALGGRDLTRSFDALQALTPPPRPAVAQWLQRAVSVLLLFAAVEQVAQHIMQRRRIPSVSLLVAFATYWVGTIALPALFGAHPQASHELLYAPAVGFAACLAQPGDRDPILRSARSSLLALLAGGLLLAPLRPTLVMDPHYSEGLLGGLPRLAGLTPHAVTQGMLALVTLLLLWACPLRRRAWQFAALALALGVLVLAQSKTTWVATLACGLAMLSVRRAPAWRARLADPRQGGFGLLACAAAALVVVVVAVTVVTGQAAQQVDRFLLSEQGAQLTSLTGRDHIWAVAAQEWREHPVFGYGLSLWDSAYRASIGLPNATHAHNQFMDDAARAGTVGATALVLYALVLGVLSLRHARASGGLSIALFLLVALRAISEVPLMLQGYGSELFTHLLLLVVLAACSQRRTHAPAQAAPWPVRMAR